MVYLIGKENKNLNNIIELKKKLSENEFEIRNLEKELNENINLIKSEIDSWIELKIINEEQEKMLRSLTLENVKNNNLETFREMFEQFNKILDSFNSNIEGLDKQLKELESM